MTELQRMNPRDMEFITFSATVDVSDLPDTATERVVDRARELGQIFCDTTDTDEPEVFVRTRSRTVNGTERESVSVEVTADSRDRSEEARVGMSILAERLADRLMNFEAELHRHHNPA